MSHHHAGHVAVCGLRAIDVGRELLAIGRDAEIFALRHAFDLNPVIFNGGPVLTVVRGAYCVALGKCPSPVRAKQNPNWDAISSSEESGLDLGRSHRTLLTVTLVPCGPSEGLPSSNDRPSGRGPVGVNHAVKDETGCLLCRFGVVAECRSRDRIGTTRREHHRQFNMRLSAGNGCAQ